MGNSDSKSEFLTPPQIKDAAEETKRNLLPTKSKKKYDGKYLTYKLWKEQNLVKQTSENVLLAYFNELSQTKRPFTLWAVFSMLKSTIDVTENVKIVSFLKKQRTVFQSKKAKVFTAAEVKEFLEKAPDDPYLVLKVIF